MDSIFNTTMINEINKLEITTSRAIKELRVFTHYKGYRYLRSSINLTVKDESLADDLGKKLYVMIAQEYDVTASQIARAIANAIEKAWEQVSPEIAEKYFGYYDPDNCPCNKQFITTVADYIRLRLK